MRRHPCLQLNHRLCGPAEEIGRAPSVFFDEFDQDAAAAFQCAMRWCATGDRADAEKSRTVVNAWTATLQRVNGTDAAPTAGLLPQPVR